MPAETTTAFRRALLYVLQRSGHAVPMTRLHKLLYLADLQYYHEHGRSITGAKWVRHNYGPMTKAMLPSLNAMSGHEVEEEKKPTLQGRELHLIRTGPAPRYEAKLSPDEAEAIETILRMTKRLTDNEVKALTYATTPMRLVAEKEEESGAKLIDLPLDFGSMTNPARLRGIGPAPDLKARARAQQEDLVAMAPSIERALSGGG